jgi:DNA repair exonuclease SbcCD ATPase subunit
MKIKHKVIKEFQYLSPDKKIFILKVGTILEEYIYKVKTELIPIDKEIIDNNPEFFEIIDWKSELLSYMKVNKLPTPSQLHKKMVPFIEEMILSSMNQNSGGQVMDEYQIKEIERKERDLNNRELRIKDKEEEIEIRLNRVEKREESYKEDLKDLDKKEDDLREKNRLITEKNLDLEDKLQDLNERERNLDRTILQSSSELDSKYSELQKKIDSDLELVSKKEKDLEFKIKELNKKESEVEIKESEIVDKIRDFEIRLEEFNLYKEEVTKLDREIKDWENLHWKFKRTKKPPSAE